MGETAGSNKGGFVKIAPDDNILVGSKLICRYLRIKSIVTLYRLVELYGLPAVKRPDGQWMTTITAIDQWLFMAADLDAQNRPHLRGTNERLETALERLKRRIEDYGPGRHGRSSAPRGAADVDS